MKGRAHARGTAGGNSMAPGPGARPPRRPARPGRSLGGPSRTRSHPVSPAGGGPRAAGPFGFPGRRCPGRTGGLARRDFREPGALPAVPWVAHPGDRRWWRRDSTPTITAIGLTRATIAKRSPTWRCWMTTPTPTTGAGSGARRRLHLSSRKYPAELGRGHSIPERLGGTAAPAGPRAAHLRCQPRPSRQDIARRRRDRRWRDRSHHPLRPGSRDAPRGSPERVSRPPLAARSGRGRPPFAVRTPAGAGRRPPPALHPSPRARSSQKYSEEEYGACSCQRPRAWLPLPKSGLHGFRQRRYR